MKLNIHIKGVDTVQKKLQKLNRILGDLSPELTEAGEEMVRFFRIDVFETTGGALDENWKPLSYRYLRSKQEEYPGKGILEATGKMRKSFKLSVNRFEGKVANTAPYAKYHQQPNGLGQGIMPRRKFMGMSHDQAKRVTEIFERSIQRRVDAL